MARRKSAGKRDILPDPLFGSGLLAKFISILMRNGKRSVAEKIVYGALQKVLDDKGKGGGDISSNDNSRAVVIGLFEKALDALKPSVEVRSCRVGGSTYQVPVEVKQGRGSALAMRWLMEAANSRVEKGMVLRLAHEILDIFDGKGAAIKRREDVHKMAKANQAFAHYRW